MTRSALSLDLADARRIIAAGERKAIEMGIPYNIAVADAGGGLVAHVRMDGAWLGSVDIAIDKAYTAAGFGLSTGAWTEALMAHSPAVRSGIPLRPRMVCFGGGLPLRHEDRLIGGIGVSGGSEQEDEACARAGVAAIGLPV